MSDWVIISLGGSMVNPDGVPDSDFIKKFAKLVRESNMKLGIVVGGGKAARVYAQAARELGANEFEADEIAIASTRQNAALLIIALGDAAYPHVLYDFESAKKAAASHRIIVMGGTIPGISTDTDAALLAEALHAKRLVNMSNVDAIYDSNPKENKNAKKYSKMSYDQLLALAMENDQRKAGTNFVFDIIACKLIVRSGIETHFVNGRNLEDVRKALAGKPHSGTVVR